MKLKMLITTQKKNSTVIYNYNNSKSNKSKISILKSTIMSTTIIFLKEQQQSGE